MKRLEQETKLNNMHICLPCEERLSRTVFDALLGSFVNRSPVNIEENDEYQYYMDDTAHFARRLITAGRGADAHIFAVTGIDGCGKTTAVLHSLRGVPDYIPHVGGPLIPYLYIDCDGIMAEEYMFHTIGWAIDRAVPGNCFDHAVDRFDSLENAAERVEQAAKYIEMLGIGMLVFDHIEFLDGDVFFPSLIQFLRHRTGIAVCVVGTKGACRRFSEQIGEEVPFVDVGSYCGDRGFFDRILKDVFDCDIFETPAVLTDETADILYDASKGSIGWAVHLYRRAASEHGEVFAINQMTGKEGPAVDAELFRKAVRQCFGRYPGGLGALIEQQEA